MGTNMKDLHKELRIKDDHIRKLQQQLQEKDELISDLRSQLDKYKSIIKPRKERGLGISAEPTDQAKSAEGSSKTFKKYNKSPK